MIETTLEMCLELFLAASAMATVHVTMTILMGLCNA